MSLVVQLDRALPYKGPGVSELTARADALTFDIGEPNGGDSPRLHEVKAILENMCSTHI